MKIQCLTYRNQTKLLSLISFNVFISLLILPLPALASEQGMQTYLVKVKNLGAATVEWLQALSSTILIGTVLLGIVIFCCGLFLGMIHKRVGDAIRASGIWIVICGFIGFIIINNAQYAPKIADLAAKLAKGVATFVQSAI